MPAAGSGGEAMALTEVRCKDCGRLLFRADANGRIEIVCHNRSCREIQTVKLAALARS
jgi:phage FluMu protein Com